MISQFRLKGNVGRITSTFMNYSWNSGNRKEAAAFKKMLDRISAREKKPTSFPSLLKKSALSSAYDNEGTSKRITALNKIYMQHITMMVNGGYWGRQLDNLGIEISKVKMASGLNFLNIYWITRRTDIPEEVLNETLKGVLAELQQEIGTLRYTSKAPFLKFVKDLRLEREIHIEEIFAAADFGKDFEPTHGRKVVTPDFVPKPGDIPVMKQDVLGLDHAAIKSRIKAQILRFKAINIDRPENECQEVKHEVPQKLIKFTKDVFLKFYKRRRALEYKIYKMHRRKEPLYEFEDTDEYEFQDVDEDEDEEEFGDELEDEFEDEFELEKQGELEDEIKYDKYKQ